MQKHYKKFSFGKKLKLWLLKDDAELSQRKLSMALNQICKNVNVNLDYDIPYIAGYSVDGKTIYIDKNIPKFMNYKNRKINIHRFLVLHEIVEKALIDHAGEIHYDLAHQIATRSEQAAVEGEQVSWFFYKKFLQKFIDGTHEETIYHIPFDLDLKPYQDVSDVKVLRKIKKVK